MKNFRRKFRSFGIITFLLELFGSGRCAPKVADEYVWTLSKYTAIPNRDILSDLSDYLYNGSLLDSDISILPDQEHTLPPSDKEHRYEPTTRICQDLYPPKDDTTMADGAAKFEYDVFIDWYSKWHLNIGFRPKKFQKTCYFKGLIVQVRHNGVPVGTYDEAPEYSIIDCPPGKENTPYYGSINDILFKFVTWKPPKDFDTKGVYVVHSTMIVEPGRMYKKKTNIPLWETLPKGYNISDPKYNSDNYRPHQLPWSDISKKLKEYEISGLMG